MAPMIPMDRPRARTSAALATAACIATFASAEPLDTSPPPPHDVIYFVMVDRFANGDPGNDGEVDEADPQAFHGGDIRGVIDHLDDLQHLGVTTVWLSPVFDSRTDKFFEWGAFHGYWVEDLTAVEPRFGTADELRLLSDELHARDMRLVLDVVFNHVAMDAPLTREHPDWFHPTCDIVDWHDPVQLTDCRVHGLPDLDQENEDVYRFLLQTSLDWIERVRPDGFRIDAVRHMRTGFLSRFSQDVRAAAGEDFLLLGEDFQGDALSLSRSFREGGFGAMFDFPLHYAMLDVYCHDRPAGRLAATLSADAQYDDPGRLVPFLDNHDRPRLTSECHEDPERVRQALTFLLTARGLPSLTYGTEAGLTGAEEPDNRADMRFDTDHALAGHIHRLTTLRRAHPALHSGATRLLTLDGELLAVARIAEPEVVAVLLNRGEGAMEWTIPGEVAPVSLVTNLETGLQQASTAVLVPPRSTRLLRWRGAHLDGPQPQERDLLLTVRGAPVDPGDELVLVGNGPALANWTPAEGLGPLQPADDGHALTLSWRTGEVLEFKAAIRRIDGSVDWQPGENHYLFVAAGQDPLTITVDW
jgi:glycosidase